MEESWDAENFEPKVATLTPAGGRWEGEDEDDDVKESWEDEEEEKKDEEKNETAAAPVKTKKKLIDKIAEKEQRAREEAERRAAEAEENMTPEQRIAEKLRRQKLQEESDLRLAMETFGITDLNATGKIDSFHPTNKAEFDEFAEMLSKKINFYRTKDEFPAFIEDLFRNVTVQMSSADIKRIKTTVDNLYIEKQKAEKNDKNKKPSKGKGKAKLRVEGDNAHLNQYDTYGNYEQDYDDFM